MSAAKDNANDDASTKPSGSNRMDYETDQEYDTDASARGAERDPGVEVPEGMTVIAEEELAALHARIEELEAAAGEANPDQKATALSQALSVMSKAKKFEVLLSTMEDHASVKQSMLIIVRCCRCACCACCVRD
jgi:hypothetical protein